MPNSSKPPLAPRLVILAGVGLNAALVFTETKAPALMLLGAGIAIAGLVWFLVAFFQARKAGN